MGEVSCCVADVVYEIEDGYENSVQLGQTNTVGV